jgi:NodT family efflux transporter outer membrane factor (OMF) lipoprotein
MEQQIDATVADEVAEIQAAAPNGSTLQLRDAVAALIDRSPGFLYLLQDARGRVLAGNLPPLAAVIGVRQWPGSARDRRNPFSGLRGRGIRVSDGSYLFVGLSTLQLHEMEELVVHAFLWGLAVVILLSLGSGAAMSLSFLRRLEAVSRTSRDIIAGDLQRRIAERGTGDEFDHLAASLNAMLDRIQGLMEGLRQVTNDIAHDMRTPLTRLRQRLELAQRRGTSDPAAAVLIEQTLHDIDATLETFGALLRIAQIESGARKAGFMPLELSEVLRNVVEIYQSALEERGQLLEVRLDCGLNVNGDRELLTQLFANLLDNAIRHSPPGSRIAICARRDGGNVDVSVADDGPGIAAEFRERVLQRFFRLEGSRSTPGNGLGLSLAQSIARLHDAELVLSDRAPGLCVTLSLRSLSGPGPAPAAHVGEVCALASGLVDAGITGAARYGLLSAMLCGAVLCGGCALQPAPARAPEVPAQFEQAGAEGGNWPAADWYRGFGSTELDALLERARQGSADLAAARARVEQADAQARIAGAALLPSVDADGNVNYYAGHSSSGTAHETDWAALFSASYEVDFWGKNHAQARSAQLAAEASVSDRDTLALTTLAGVADAYFQVLALRERIASARLDAAASEQVLQLIQARYAAGVASAVELASQRAAGASVALVLPQLQQQEVAARAALALLLGAYPEGFEVQGATLQSLAEPAIGAGLPSELLLRRPDLKAAEARLRAAQADVVVARAALLPALTLSGAAGLQNPAVNAAVIALSGTGPTLALGGSLAQAVFDGGRRRALREQARSRAEELLQDYRAAILASLQDVEAALALVHALDAQQDAQAQRLEQSERAFTGAQLRYREGSGDYLTLLEAQRAFYAARDESIQYRLARLQARVDLSKALGGGWQAGTTRGAPST